MLLAASNLAKGLTPMCGWIHESAKDVTMHVEQSKKSLKVLQMIGEMFPRYIW